MRPPPHEAGPPQAAGALSLSGDYDYGEAHTRHTKAIQMKSSKDFADLLTMIQEKRNEYQQLGTQYDDAETRISEQEKQDDATAETNDTREP